jgi:magnesium-protoporphyrin O-methyltransferase
MSECCNPNVYREFFDQKEAMKSLRRYQRKGIDGMTRSLLDYMTSRGMEGRSVLEPGGGIGAVQIELLKAGASSAINVELSGSYEVVASELLEHEGLTGRVQRRIGDFTELAGELEADDVVMNRVICCYPFMDRLMQAAISSSRRFVAAVFPRDHLVSRLMVATENAYCRVRGIDFRGFVHSPDEIMKKAQSKGFDVAFHDHDFVWNAVVFEKVQSLRK